MVQLHYMNQFSHPSDSGQQCHSLLDGLSVIEGKSVSRVRRNQQVENCLEFEI